MRYDVVVVGGGPAGSSVARSLSQQGAKVLLLEKEKLPRFKLCGGCLSARTVELLPEGWRSEVLNEIRKGILGFRGERFVEKTARRAVAYIIERSSFDYFLLKSAVACGVELWEGVEFLGFENDGNLLVRTSAGDVEADFLVGADGFYTKVGKQLGYKKENFFRSVEFFIEGSLEDSVVIDIGVVSRGYAWIFPKGNLLSVGVATTGRENLREVLEGYVRTHPYLSRREIGKLKGWMIPFLTSPSQAQLGRGRVLLVGDSANLVDPLLGEGIFYAIKSGQLLSSAILSSPGNVLGKYTSLLKENVLPELVYAGKIARLAYRFQRVAFRMGGGFAMDRFFSLLSGDIDYRTAYIKGMPDFVKSLLHFENFLHIIIDKIQRRR